MTPGELILLIITILMGVLLWFIIEERNKWKDRFYKKVSYIFSTDYEIGKEVNCIDYFYVIYNDKVCKFKTEELVLNLINSKNNNTIYELKDLVGICIEGSDESIGDRKVFNPEDVFLTKKSLLENI